MRVKRLTAILLLIVTVIGCSRRCHFSFQKSREPPSAISARRLENFIMGFDIPAIYGIMTIKKEGTYVLKLT